MDHCAGSRAGNETADYIEREYWRAMDEAQAAIARTGAEAARHADEQAITLLGHARPLPKRNPIMPTEDGTPIPPTKRLVRRQRHAELAENLTIDPVMWAEAFKATWSVGESVEGLAGWFRDAMATALAADEIDRRGSVNRFPNRYIVHGTSPLADQIHEHADRMARAGLEQREAQIRRLLAEGGVPVIALDPHGGEQILDARNLRDHEGVCRVCGEPRQCEHCEWCPGADPDRTIAAARSTIEDDRARAREASHSQADAERRYNEARAALDAHDRARDAAWLCKGSLTTPSSTETIEGERCGTCSVCGKTFRLIVDDGPAIVIQHSRPDRPTSSYDNGSNDE